MQQQMMAPKWPTANLGAPTDPMALVYASRAQSILLAMQVRDNRGLTVSEAKDVIRWSGQPI